MLSMKYVIYKMGVKILPMPYNFSDDTIIMYIQHAVPDPRQVLTKCWLLLQGH